MFSTPEISVHVWYKNREISPLERERKVTGEMIWKKVSFKTRMEDPMRHVNHRFRSRVGAWEWRRGLSLRWPIDKEREEMDHEVCSIGEVPHTEKSG